MKPALDPTGMYWTDSAAKTEPPKDCQTESCNWSTATLNYYFYSASPVLSPTSRIILLINLLANKPAILPATTLSLCHRVRKTLHNNGAKERFAAFGPHRNVSPSEAYQLLSNSAIASVILVVQQQRSQKTGGRNGRRRVRLHRRVLAMEHPPTRLTPPSFDRTHISAGSLPAEDE